MNLFAPVAVWGFWVFLLIGWIFGELRWKGTVVFVLLWLAGYIGAPLALNGALFIPYVAVLDIALVLMVFKGDIRLDGR
jgi:hypothetical protein